MSDIVYIARLDDDVSAIGNTLKDAYDNLTDIATVEDISDVGFYEATKVEVEILVVKKEVVKSIKPAKV